MILNNSVNTEEHIIAAASGLFCKFGMKSVAMDNIARECGMSKKTLYQYFTDKATLINRVVQEIAAHHQAKLEEAKLVSSNVIEEVFNEFKIYVSALHDMHAVFFYELEKSFPDSWNFLVQLNNEYGYPFVVSNLNRGVSEGFYRSDLDIAATADIRMSQLRLMVTRNIHFVEARNILNDPDQVNLFYLHAITTPEGKEMMNKILKEHREKNGHQL